jgi:hypothetical protein
VIVLRVALHRAHLEREHLAAHALPCFGQRVPSSGRGLMLTKLGPSSDVPDRQVDRTWLARLSPASKASDLPDGHDRRLHTAVGPNRITSGRPQPQFDVVGDRLVRQLTFESQEGVTDGVETDTCEPEIRKHPVIVVVAQFNFHG